ncbi:hypothetical protein HYDPIDRAFT_165875 [Hydnomerulius pinastri MD-312]|nr:hypothetical protein HYDPIDRAFT_165875 [Hydnomerulius pinastri MD-312]
MAPTQALPVDASPSYLDRLQAFVSENKRGIIVGTAAAAIAVGAVYYAASSSSRFDSDKGKSKDKKKDKSGSSKKRKTVNDPDGPILEEIKPKEAEDARLSAEEIAAMPVEVGFIPMLPSNPLACNLHPLPLQERIKLAGTLKSRGNTQYQARKFDLAADLYTQAIEVSPKPESVFYSNRAACYMNMSPPLYERVVADCDDALRSDPNYVKALNRRANALESLSRYEEALRDFTAATILEKFQNEAAAQAVERVLKKLATEKAQAIVLTREPRLPSQTFISAYFAAFRKRVLYLGPHPKLPETPSQGDQTLLLALEALDAADYAHALTLVNEALDQGVSWDIGRAEALNLRGTFKFLTADVLGAKADLMESLSLNPHFTQSLVKLASVHMEEGNNAQAMECFETAIQADENDPDVYYHRGQVFFITNDFSSAATNYTKSTSLDSTFVFSHIQLAVAQYKMGNCDIEVSPEVLVHLAQLPALRELVTDIPSLDPTFSLKHADAAQSQKWFGCLKKLQILAPDINSVIGFLSFMSPGSPLRSVVITFKSHPQPKQVERALTLLAGAGPALEMLYLLCQQSPLQPRPGVLSGPPFPLKPLIPLSNLTTLDINIGSLECDLNNHIVQEIALAWPKLRLLRLYSSFGVDSRPKVTLPGLLPLLQHCSALVSLTLPVDAETGVTEDDEFLQLTNGIKSSSLEDVYFYQSPISNPNRVFAFLSEILPLTCKFRCNALETAYDELWDADEGSCNEPSPSPSERGGGR